MRNLRRWALGLSTSIFVLFLFGTVQAESSVPQARLSRLSHGVNIPHWFWLPGSDDLPTHWRTYLSAAELQTMTDWGVRHVRIPVDIQYLFDWDKPDQLKPDALPYLDTAIRNFIQHNIAVIICPFGDFQEKVSQPGYLERAVNFWRLFAAHLRPFDPNWVLLQTANEPSDVPANWQVQQGELLRAMRESAPDHTLITSPSSKFGPGDEDWGGIRALTMMQPYTDTNIVYGLHFYEPFMFTHQGADWAGWPMLLSGVPYPATEQDARGLEERLAKEITDPEYAWVPGMIPAYVREGWNAEKLAEALRPALDWAARHDVPLIVDEFGVYRNGGAPRFGRTRWLNDVRNILEGAGAGWTMWDYAGGFALALSDPAHPGQRVIDDETAKAVGLWKR